MAERSESFMHSLQEFLDARAQLLQAKRQELLQQRQRAATERAHAERHLQGILLSLEEARQEEELWQRHLLQAQQVRDALQERLAQWSSPAPAPGPSS